MEGCGRKFCTPQERKQHLVGHHRFPRNYAFDRIHLRRAALHAALCTLRFVRCCAVLQWGGSALRKTALLHARSSVTSVV